jgi:RNA 2',3'-cyclic 3'-phosphodiesterase
MLGSREDRVRLFVAIELPPEQKEAIRVAVEPWTRLEAKWVRVDGLHLTLAFLGETPESRLVELAQRLDDVGRRHRPARVWLTGAGAFGGARPRVLWLGVGGELEPLTALASELAVALGLPAGPWTAHVTIARAKPRGGDRSLLEVVRGVGPLRGEPFLASTVTLFESRGGRYVARHRAPLSGDEAVYR